MSLHLNDKEVAQGKGGEGEGCGEKVPMYIRLPLHVVFHFVGMLS